MKTDVLILGGGLAGLSTAYHLNRLGGVSSLVVEKEPAVGGTAGSVRQGDFTFDHTGHLLHLHDPYGKRLILRLLGKNVARRERNSWIYSSGVHTRYPFQANTYGLPPRAVEECLTGFLETVHWPKPPRSASFRDWCLSAFGTGISRSFMFPYNEKLYRIGLSKLTTEWQGRFVPKPKPAEVLLGALDDQRAGFGYNASFHYPLRGGIQVLPDALAARLKAGQIRTRSPVRRVDLREKAAEVEGIGEIRYERLVNTLPLPFFLDMVEGLAPDMRRARRALRYNTVYNINLGIARSNISDKHWIYFPEKRFVFYRAGFSSNFSPHIAPRGATSMYIEIARRPDEKVSLPGLERQVLDGLRACGILRLSDRLLARAWMPIRCAYVVYDFNRTPAVNAIMGHLAKKGVESIGRYGGWKYSFMEETILDGKRCAERLGGRALAEEAVSQEELKPLK